jgi:hypothetical protein
MCVAVKRKLQLFYWKNNGFLDLHEDLSVVDVPRALAWCQETICVGFKGDYCLMQACLYIIFITDVSFIARAYIVALAKL